MMRLSCYLLTRDFSFSLSRADMGDALVAIRGYPRERVVRVPCASVVRDPPSPQDIISMRVERVQQVLGIRLTPFCEALHDIFC